MQSTAGKVRLGLRANAPQFSLLVVVNGFVGAMAGMERSILPAIAEQEFQLAARTAVLSFIVEQRRYEIGVRMALGARTGSVTALVLRQSLVLGAIGTGVGALVAAGTSVFLRGMMFGLPPIDPVAFTGSALLMLAVVVLASAVPALRAARVDPMVSLRSN